MLGLGKMPALGAGLVPSSCRDEPVGLFWCPFQEGQQLLMVLPWVSCSCLYCSALLVLNALLWVPLAALKATKDYWSYRELMRGSAGTDGFPRCLYGSRMRVKPQNTLTVLLEQIPSVTESVNLIE